MLTFKAGVLTAFGLFMKIPLLILVVRMFLTVDKMHVKMIQCRVDKIHLLQFENSSTLLDRSQVHCKGSSLERVSSVCENIGYQTVKDRFFVCFTFC